MRRAAFITVRRAVAALVAATALAGVSSACRSSAPPDEDRGYADRIAASRASKDDMFQHAPDSPVPQSRRADVLPLAYFAIDPAYVVPAGLKPSESTRVLQMPTSTGQMRDMRRVGTLEFTLKGQPLKLAAFVEVGAPDVNHLFVPFTDVTSGTETYPGGRYLDLDRNATGIYEIDFNRAYQPYCSFNPTFDCPYPPSENRLAVPVRAGERLKVPNR